jgi:hypothetical protein
MPVQSAETLGKSHETCNQSFAVANCNHYTLQLGYWRVLFEIELKEAFTTLIILGVSFVFLPLVHIYHITVVNSSGTFDDSRPVGCPRRPSVQLLGLLVQALALSMRSNCSFVRIVENVLIGFHPGIA